jgi:hypothetical protein
MPKACQAKQKLGQSCHRDLWRKQKSGSRPKNGGNFDPEPLVGISDYFIILIVTVADIQQSD